VKRCRSYKHCPLCNGGNGSILAIMALAGTTVSAPAGVKTLLVTGLTPGASYGVTILPNGSGYVVTVTPGGVEAISETVRFCRWQRWFLPLTARSLA